MSAQQQRHELARSVERWTGNAAQIVELSTAQVAKAVRHRRSCAE